jgi:hypothetical protein
MRLLTLLLATVILCSYSCRKKSEDQLSTLVKFEQKKYEEALQLAQQQNKLLMVDFWSPG